MLFETANHILAVDVNRGARTQPFRQGQSFRYAIGNDYMLGAEMTTPECRRQPNRSCPHDQDIFTRRQTCGMDGVECDCEGLNERAELPIHPRR